jgi:hypothetical protein
MDILTQIERQLRNAGDEKTRMGAKRFFKEEIHVYGVKSAVGKAIAQ